MMENQNRDWTVWLYQQRSIVLKVIFSFIIALGFVGIVFSGYQAITTGSISFNLIYYSLSYLGLIILFLLRKIPDLWRSLGYLILIFVFGILSFYSGWLAGGGRIFLLAFIVMTAVLIHPRSGFIAAGICLVTYAVFGLAFNKHWLTLRALPDPTTTQPIILEGVGYAITIAMVSLGLWYFGRALMAADRANHEAQEARAQLDDHARKLEEANALIARQAKASVQRSDEELRLAYDATIEGWSYALDLRDRETEGHTRRVVEMTLLLARHIGISEDELVHIRRGALLHDIGKMGIPDMI